MDFERALGLKPASPQVALELEGHDLTVVRVKRSGRGRPQLAAHQTRHLDEPAVPATIFDQKSVSEAELAERLRELFERGGIRPGRVSIVLPDNLAKVTLLTLPERPSSRKQLLEIVRFKMHRAVPFRLSEASLTYQLLPGEGKGPAVLVAVMRRSLIEKYERALESIGARPGVVDLCTPNLLNLCRGSLKAAEGRGGDVAVLNCAQSYFSLVISRKSRLIFFRCKTYSMTDGHPSGGNGSLAREIAGSLSYYEEKLDGQGVGTLLVRSVDATLEEIRQGLGGLGVERIGLIDPAASLALEGGSSLEREAGQRIAPAVGAAVGRA